MINNPSEKFGDIEFLMDLFSHSKADEDVLAKIGAEDHQMPLIMSEGHPDAEEMLFLLGKYNRKKDKIKVADFKYEWDPESKDFITVPRTPEDISRTIRHEYRHRGIDKIVNHEREKGVSGIDSDFVKLVEGRILDLEEPAVKKVDERYGPLEFNSAEYNMYKAKTKDPKEKAALSKEKNVKVDAFLKYLEDRGNLYREEKHNLPAAKDLSKKDKEFLDMFINILPEK